MTTYLTLHNASIVHMTGWGTPAPRDGGLKVELRDIGELAVYRPTSLRHQQILTLPIDQLSLTTGIYTATTGVRWVGGGFGITGALVGAAKARALNAMTRQRIEAAVLAATVTLRNGAQRKVTLSFGHLTQSELIDHLDAAMPEWAEGYVAAVLDGQIEGPGASGDLQAAYAAYDRMQSRGMLTDAHALTLRSHASGPFIDATTRRLRENRTTPQEAASIQAQIEQLRHAARITNNQAHHVTTQLPRAAPPPQPTRSRADQKHSIDALVALRKSGALTEAEFQAAKAHIV